MKDILTMAHEAGLKVGTNISGIVLIGSPNGNTIAHITEEELQRFADLIRADAVPPGYVVVHKSTVTAFLVEGYDGDRLIAKHLSHTVDDAKNTASVFAQHYPTVHTKPLYRAMLEAAPKENNNEPT